MAALITVEEAAQMLKCRRTTVFKLLAEGKIQRAPKFGKQTVIFADSVLTLIAAGIPELKKRGRPRKKRAIPQVEPRDYGEEILSLIQ